MLQFQCGFCHTILTVPAQMAGVSGPCPSCGQTVTSPTPAPAAPPMQQWSPPPVAAPAPAPPPAWPPAPLQSPMLGELPRTSMPPQQPNSGLPPKRAPGQPPLTASLPSAPGQMPWNSAPGTPPLGSLDAPAGFSGSALPNQSRLIPGSPALPNMMPGSHAGGGMPGFPSSQSGSTLLGREMSPSPAPQLTQPLQAGGTPALSLGSAFGQDGSAGAPVAPIPSGRSIASLRAPRGTNFIRLAFAAIFLLGFLGLVGYLLKDYLPGLFPGLAGHEVAEENTKEASLLSTPTPLKSNPSSSSSTKPVDSGPTEKATSQPIASAETKTSPAPITAGFDPKEPVAPKTETAVTATSTTETARPASPPATANAMPVGSPPAATATGTLLEVPAKAVVSAESSGSQRATPGNLAPPLSSRKTIFLLRPNLRSMRSKNSSPQDPSKNVCPTLSGRT